MTAAAEPAATGMAAQQKPRPPPVPRPFLVQLGLFAVGAVILIATGLWILPGLPFILAIKVAYAYREPLKTRLAALPGAQAAIRAAAAAAAALLLDPRDKPLMLVSVGCAVIVTLLTGATAAALVLAPAAWQTWALVVGRQAIMTGVLVSLFTARHQESHRARRATYKHPVAAALLTRINEWWTGTMYGNVPEIDRCGHGFVHHRNDMDEDDWANAHLDRCNLFQFAQYVVTAGGWHTSGVGLLIDFAREGQERLFTRTLTGMAAYYSAAAAFYLLAGPLPFTVLFLWPYVSNMGFGSVVNWSWHVFADPQDPENYAAATITVLEWPGDVFNEGLHLSHHMMPAAHFSELPALYAAAADAYAAAGNVVLRRGDPLEIWFNAMVHRWSYFADQLVDPSGGEMTPKQRAAFVRYRTRPVGSAPATPDEAAASEIAQRAAAAAGARLRAAVESSGGGAGGARLRGGMLKLPRLAAAAAAAAADEEPPAPAAAATTAVAASKLSGRVTRRTAGKPAVLA